MDLQIRRHSHWWTSIVAKQGGLKIILDLSSLEANRLDENCLSVPQKLDNKR